MRFEVYAESHVVLSIHYIHTIVYWLAVNWFLSQTGNILSLGCLSEMHMVTLFKYIFIEDNMGNSSLFLTFICFSHRYSFAGNLSDGSDPLAWPFCGMWPILTMPFQISQWNAYTFLVWKVKIFGSANIFLFLCFFSLSWGLELAYSCSWPAGQLF